jgi:hypothetical protein
LNSNPYAPPKAFVADIAGQEESPPLWNPNAAANWSLLFSPVFGAYLQMKNWEALGEPEKAAAAKVWAIASLAVLIGMPLLVVLVPGLQILQSVSSVFGLVLLISWYSSNGRPQARYVKERFGKNYPRKGWGKPLLIAFAATIGYFVAIGIVVGFVMGLTGNFK